MPRVAFSLDHLCRTRYARPSSRVDRLTLGWVNVSGPLFERAGQGAVTVVVVWPTDVAGRIDRDGVLREPVEVLPWFLSMLELSELRDIHRWWPLHEGHDLLVCPHAMIPCRDTMRTWERYAEIASRVDRVVRDLCSDS